MKNKLFKGLIVIFILAVNGLANAGVITFTPSGTSTVAQGASLYWDMLSDTTSTSSIGAVGDFYLSDHGDIHFNTTTADMVNIGSGTGGYVFAIGEMIGASSNWSNSDGFVGTTDYSGTMSFGDTGIFGLSFQLTGQTHYGWVEIAENDNNTQSVLAWGYETVAGQSIAAGAAEVPEPSVLAMLALGLMCLASLRLSQKD